MECEAWSITRRLADDKVLWTASVLHNRSDENRASLAGLYQPRLKFGDLDDGRRQPQGWYAVGADLDEEAAGVPDPGLEDSMHEKRLVVVAEGA